MSMNADQDGHTEVQMGSERSFGIVFAVVFALVAGWPLAYGAEPRYWAAGIATAFLVLALAWPSPLAPLNRLWFRFGMILGRIVAPVVMALVYFLVVTPTGLIMRLRGHDLLRQRRDPSAKSYWIERDQPVGSMKNQF